MNIGITTFGCDQGRSGIGRYLTNHLTEFQKLGLRPRVFGSQNDQSLVPFSFPRELVSPMWDRPLPNLVLHQSWLPARTQNLDVLFLPAANRRIPWTASCPMVGTVHDLAVAKLEGKYDASRTFYISKVLPKLVRKLDHILTVSEYSKADIVDVTGVSPNRISVTPLGVDHSRYYPRNEAIDLTGYGIDSPFILYISRIEHPGKNHQRLLLAFENIKKELKLPHQLVLVGADWKGAEHVHRLADKLECRKDIIFTGFFPEKHLPHLYSQAEAMVFPSLYEGFGLPVLEAMACGLPVICSDRASLPEVVGEAGFLFDPDHPEQLEKQLAHILTCKTAHTLASQEGRYRSLSFQWSRTAAQTLRVLQSVAAGRPVESQKCSRMDGALKCV